MKFALIVDPLEGLKAYKDSSVAIMREMARRGHEVWTVQREALTLRGDRVAAIALRILPEDGDHPWFKVLGSSVTDLADFDAVLMRQDPPFDFEYVAATWLLERAAASGARVFNHPRAIRDHSEKIAITEFPQYIATTLVARSADDIQAFIDEMAREGSDVILKPLDGMGGSSIFRVARADPNRNVIIEMLTQLGNRTIMAQRYIPAIAEGDKRILLIDGKPVPYCLARIPKPGESRGNLAAGGTGVAQPLSQRDRDIADSLGPLLAARGLLLVGLDVIGDYLTEINVTSPTCFVEITQQTGFSVTGMFADALEARSAVPSAGA
jgi:glutathione synthase